MADEPGVMVIGRQRRMRASAAGLLLAASAWALSASGSVFASGAETKVESGFGAGESNTLATFEAIAAAETSLSLRVSQLRRVLEVGPAGPAWTGIREDLVLTPDQSGSGEARFDLQFAGLEGSSSAAMSEPTRRELYRGYAGYLHLHANFRVVDPQLATQNYVVIDLGSRVRLDRPTRRIALLPRQLGRSPWVLELDAATSYPLYRAEFNPAGVLVSTLEVTRFEEVTPLSLTGHAFWQPTRNVEDFRSIQTAVQVMALEAAPVLPASNRIPSGYRFSKARVVRELLRPESSLVVTYTDGIDEIFVVSTFGAAAPSLPVMSAQGSYAILAYQDQNVAQFLFHVGSVTTMVVGRAGQFALPSIAEDLLARSLQSR
ncbi:MAG: hypothetical protein O2865_01010 [Planctomycetota bacterium]|nr:hypothetical protein [Planctomycetota bacterium]MDA0932748.1 hypothetical protein [Planctomycetota bacterium]